MRGALLVLRLLVVVAAACGGACQAPATAARRRRLSFPGRRPWGAAGAAGDGDGEGLCDGEGDLGDRREVSGAAVVVEHVRKGFEGGRIRALEDVSLSLDPGELVALTGPSGCGKSTLLNLIGALDRPDAGEIHVDGEDVTRLDDPSRYRAEVVGFVFQFHNLITTLSASENVQIPMLGRHRRAERERHARELLEEVGLSARTDSYPPTLSGGERQRVAIARALANGPRLLLADEPTGSLDSETGSQILDVLHRVRDEHGMTILLVTNDDDIAGQAERVLRIRDGMLAATPDAALRSA